MGFFFPPWSSNYIIPSYTLHEFLFLCYKKKINMSVLNYQKNDFTAGVFFELFEVCGFDDIKFVSTHKLAALD